MQVQVGFDPNFMSEKSENMRTDQESIGSLPITARKKYVLGISVFRM
jgi:hypothetical protein